MDSSMVQQLQAEVSLLVRELKDRDRELNNMVLSHQRQLACWNKDREGTLHLREQLTLSEERNLAIKMDLGHAQASLSECRDQMGTLRGDRGRLEELESSLISLREENDQLSISLRSADSKVAELSGNEFQLRNALNLALEGAESLQLDLQENAGSLLELKLIREENEQLREEANSSRDRALDLSNQIEALRGQLERERETAIHELAKLQSGTATLERQLEVYRVAEERKTQLLASYRSKQEKMESELRAARELIKGHKGHNHRPVSNGHSSPLHLRSELISPQKPTRDLSPSSPRTMDDPFPAPSSPVSPSLLRPRTLAIIPDAEETDSEFSQEMARVASCFQSQLDTILHSIEPPVSPWQQRSLSAIPEEEPDPGDTRCPPDSHFIH